MIAAAAASAPPPSASSTASQPLDAAHCYCRPGASMHLHAMAPGLSHAANENMSHTAQLRTALEKRQATAQARAALAGITLHIVTGDDGRPEYIATRWALTKAFDDIGDVEAWLDRVGAPA